MKLPLVSVIIPVFNGEKYLAETLDSIHKQNYNPLEIIVVDDGSSDNSAEIAQSYQKIRYIYQENRGVPVARNRGIEESNGAFIAFSDQDDLWKPHKLKTQMSYLLDHPKTDYVISKRKLLPEPGVKRPSWLKEELLYTEDVDHSPSSLLARKSVFVKIGLFQTSFENASDVDWFFRVKDQRLKKAIIPEVLYLKRIHSENQSHRVKNLHSEYLKLIKNSLKNRREE